MPFVLATPFPASALTISSDVARAADHALKEFAADAITDLSKFHLLSGIMQRLATLPAITATDAQKAAVSAGGGDPSVKLTLSNLFAEPGVEERSARAFVEVLVATSLRVSGRLLAEFEQIIADDRREEEVHRFLTANPVFLDPLARRLISKHKLGDDFITDFVLERLTSDYVVVEIEKPQSQLFTGAGDFTSEFTHGLRQVLDFQNWIGGNIAYARTKLPKIGSPPGLLVIGRSWQLSQVEKERLRSFQRNSPHVQILGFDDLLERTRILYENLLKD